MPVVLAVAFLVGGSSDGSGATPATSATPGPLMTTVPAPAADVEKICDPVMAQMPVTLDDGAGTTIRPLVVTPGGPTFLAWGNPLVTLQCGTPRPSWLRSDVDYGSPTLIADTNGIGASWVPMGSGDRITLTVIDRAVYFQAEIPKGDVPFLQAISIAIGKALPPVCTQPAPGDGPDAKYCGNRP